MRLSLRPALPLVCIVAGTAIGGAYVVVAAAQDDPEPATGPAPGAVVVRDETRAAAERALAKSAAFRDLTRGVNYSIAEVAPWTTFQTTRQVGLVLSVRLATAVTVEGPRPSARYPQMSSENAKPEPTTEYHRQVVNDRTENVRHLLVWYDATTDDIVGIEPAATPEESPPVRSPGGGEVSPPPASDRNGSVPPPPLPPEN